MCDRLAIQEFGVEVRGIEGVPSGIMIRVGVVGGQIQIHAVDMTRDDRRHAVLAIDSSDLKPAMDDLVRARSFKHGSMERHAH